MYTHNNDWKQEEIASAKALWETTTLSAREISAIIGRTRAGVIGRARRDGWVKKLKPKTPPKEKPKKQKKEKPVVVFVMKEIKKPEITKTVSLIDLQNHHCREVIGDPKNGMFCGCRVKSGSSYCSRHHKKNYVKPKFNGGKVRSFVEVRI